MNLRLDDYLQAMKSDLNQEFPDVVFSVSDNNQKKASEIDPQVSQVIIVPSRMSSDISDDGMMSLDTEISFTVLQSLSGADGFKVNTSLVCDLALYLNNRRWRSESVGPMEIVRLRNAFDAELNGFGLGKWIIEGRQEVLIGDEKDLISFIPDNLYTKANMAGQEKIYPDSV